MLEPIKRFLTPPVFEGDDEKARVAGMLNTITLGLLVMLALYGAVTVIFLPAAASPPVIGAVGVLEIAVLLLLRRGNVRLASVLQIAALWIIITLAVFTSGGIASAGATGYALMIVMAGLFLGWPGTVVFTALSVAAELGLIYAQQQGQLPPLTGGAMDTWATHTAVFVTIGIALYLANRSMAHALDRARRNELSVAESNRELQAARAALEERNRRLDRSVQKYIAYMTAVEQGKLRVELDLEQEKSLAASEAEMAALVSLGESMQRMVAALLEILRQVRNVVKSLDEAAMEIRAATVQQASGASEQSAAIAQTTTTVEELKTIAEQSVARAQTMADAARRTVEVSRSGRMAVQETIGGMAQIKARVEGIAGNILTLAERMLQIGEIITSVNEIAAQSNMLALNASVEAARAGEAGKGFAVVAAEVRRLAEQSRQATAQIRAILSDIQKATNMTVTATEEGTKRVDEGVRLAAQAQESIEQLSGVIEESAQAATQLVAGGRQQATGVEQVALAMQSINQATLQGLASTRQAEKAAHNLSELAQSLVGIVEYYEL